MLSAGKTFRTKQRRVDFPLCLGANMRTATLLTIVMLTSVTLCSPVLASAPDDGSTVTVTLIQFHGTVARSMAKSSSKTVQNCTGLAKLIFTKTQESL